MNRFWMAGILAEELEEISHDPKSLSQPGFWAVLGTFEGEWTFARFNKTSKSEFPIDEEPLQLSEWSSNLDHKQYLDYVESARDEIAAGTFYQVNACRILSAKILSGGISAIFPRILRDNPAPYAGVLQLSEIEIVSASPERFTSIREGVITTSPIKGTSADGKFAEKDAAENLMIVDLMRNDLGRVCETGSIKTPRLNAVEAHPGLYHLVSDVQGILRKDLSLGKVIETLMPPGSVSGAPKSSALKMIKKWEGRRGPYCGVFGWAENGNCELAVGIRTFWRDGEFLRFGTGAGITWGSDPESEWQETELKARRLISIASGR